MMKFAAKLGDKNCQARGHVFPRDIAKGVGIGD